MHSSSHTLVGSGCVEGLSAAVATSETARSEAVVASRTLRLGRFPWACERAVVESFKLRATLSESKRETTDTRISVLAAQTSSRVMKECTK
jgi:hypothetical protein